MLFLLGGEILGKGIISNLWDRTKVWLVQKQLGLDFPEVKCSEVQITRIVKNPVNPHHDKSGVAFLMDDSDGPYIWLEGTAKVSTPLFDTEIPIEAAVNYYLGMIPFMRDIEKRKDPAISDKELASLNFRSRALLKSDPVYSCARNIELLIGDELEHVTSDFSVTRKLYYQVMREVQNQLDLVYQHLVMGVPNLFADKVRPLGFSVDLGIDFYGTFSKLTTLAKEGFIPMEYAYLINPTGFAGFTDDKTYAVSKSQLELVKKAKREVDLDRCVWVGLGCGTTHTPSGGWVKTQSGVYVQKPVDQRSIDPTPAGSVKIVSGDEPVGESKPVGTIIESGAELRSEELPTQSALPLIQQTTDLMDGKNAGLGVISSDEQPISVDELVQNMEGPVNPNPIRVTIIRPEEIIPGETYLPKGVEEPTGVEEALNVKEPKLGAAKESEDPIESDVKL